MNLKTFGIIFMMGGVLIVILSFLLWLLVRDNFTIRDVVVGFIGCLVAILGLIIFIIENQKGKIIDKDGVKQWQ